jgi:large subunit ribosomal protein L17
MVELVDYNEIYNPNGKKAKKTTRRGKSKKTDSAQVEVKATEEKSEE